MGRPQRAPTFHPQRADARQVVVPAGRTYSCVPVGQRRSPSESPPGLWERYPQARAPVPAAFKNLSRNALFEDGDGEVYRNIFRRSQ
jgi:hypothetical protein